MTDSIPPMAQQLGVMADRIAELRTRIETSAQNIAGLRSRMAVMPPAGPFALDYAFKVYAETIRLHILIEAWELVTGSKWHDEH